MSEGSLRRTVRRITALLMLPLSFLVIQYSIQLRKQLGLVNSQIVDIAESTGYALVLVSVVYLAGSVVWGGYARI